MSLVDPTRQYRYSFSGADARVWAYYEDGGEDRIRMLESVHTISVSVHEAKGQARALGHRGIKGLARGVRTIAGSMILTVVEDNPLRPLMEILLDMQNRGVLKWPGWSLDMHDLGTGSALDGRYFNNRIAPLLPPFNFLIEYVSEGAKWAEKSTSPKSIVDIEAASLLIRGVEFIDEGMVTSVNDVVTEITLSFLATDLKPITKHSLLASRKTWNSQDNLQNKDAQIRNAIFNQNQTDRIPYTVPISDEVSGAPEPKGLSRAYRDWLNPREG